MKTEILPGRIYKHYKGGRYYVLGTSEESNNARTGTVAVLYLSLTYGVWHHRDLTEFIEEVEWPDDKKRPRFVLEVLNDTQTTPLQT